MISLLRTIGSFYAYFGGLSRLAGETLACTIVLAARGPMRSIAEVTGKAMGQLAKMGAFALSVNLLCVSLISFAISYSSADLLKRYGGNVYLVDIVAIGLCEHLVPVLTGIIVAGHSGSRVAAELGTMQVTDEITAMRTMAMNPVKLLLIPRIGGMTLAVPFLTIAGDLAGLAVSALVGWAFLDLSFESFYLRLLLVLRYDAYLEIGLWKSLAFGFVVAHVSCFRGMRVRGGAEAVGRATTASVVDSIIFVIAINTIVTVLRFSVVKGA